MRFWRALLLAFAATHSCSAQDDTQQSDEPAVKAEPAVKGEVGRRFIGSTVIYDNYASFKEHVIKSKDAWVIAVVPQANSDIEVNSCTLLLRTAQSHTFSLQREDNSQEPTLVSVCSHVSLHHVFCNNRMWYLAGAAQQDQWQEAFFGLALSTAKSLKSFRQCVCQVMV
jgi:hypothetical protein